MQAVEKLQAIVDEKKAERLSLWSEIKKRDPVLAKFLESVNRVFGKPASFSVRFK